MISIQNQLKVRYMLRQENITIRVEVMWTIPVNILTRSGRQMGASAD